MENSLWHLLEFSTPLLSHSIKIADIYSAVKHEYVAFATMHRRYPLLIAASAYALAQQLLFVLLRPLWGTMSMIII
jgi:hypothetical protein